MKTHKVLFLVLITFNCCSLLGQITGSLEFNGFERTMKFLKVLNELSKHRFVNKIGSFGYLNSMKSNKKNTQSEVQGYIFRNFNKDIKLKDVANIAHMNTSAFSRYFKKLTGKTFVQFVFNFFQS